MPSITGTARTRTSRGDMAFTSRTRLVNPRLGTYFGIFTAAFAALVLLAMMFEQLGATDAVVRLTMFGGPVALYAVIGIACRAREVPDYFACGRRVPAFFNGLVLAVTALGGAGILCVPLILLLAAEARFAAYAAAWMLGQSERMMAAVVVACAAGIVLLGG